MFNLDDPMLRQYYRVDQDGDEFITLKNCNLQEMQDCERTLKQMKPGDGPLSVYTNSVFFEGNFLGGIPEKLKKYVSTLSHNNVWLDSVTPGNPGNPIIVFRKEKKKVISQSKFMKELNELLEIDQTLIWILTFEEDRLIAEIKASQDKSQQEIFVWSGTSGVMPIENYLSGTSSESGSNEAVQIMNYMRGYTSVKKGIFILRDFGALLEPRIERCIRDTISILKRKKIHLIITSPHLQYLNQVGLPPTLEKEIVVLDYRLPEKDELEKFLNTLPQGQKDVLDFDTATSILQGLTLQEAEVAIKRMFLKEGSLEVLSECKKQIIKRSDILELIETDLKMNDVGGLENLKKYFQIYAECHSEEAQKFGVEPLRGVLITGVCGTGKSLICKAAASIWKVPLLKLDIGRVMGGLVGLSEQRIRQALQQAEAMAPCLLYLDEIEKMLSGLGSSGSSDGGATSRVIGTLLTAMQEGLKGVTILASANDISALPPELIRRFNEIFFVDLPDEDERKDIFKIHLKKRNRNELTDNSLFLAQQSQDYTGAEIEKAIKDAIAKKFASDLGKKDITKEDIVDSLKEVTPISRIMKEQIEEIREWAKNRARSAR
jgi:SpoVK/Ycf46/Vps4 family AAA+-type ATPase